MNKGPSKKLSSSEPKALSPNKLLEQSLKNQDAEGIKAALSKGANPNGKIFGTLKTYLSEAIHIGDDECVQALIDAKGIDINLQIDGRVSALHWAVFSKNIPVIKLLLSKGANVNAWDMQEGTPLTVAVERKFHEVAEILVNNGADPHIETNRIGTAFQRAEKNKDQEMLDILNGKPRKIQPAGLMQRIVGLFNYYTQSAAAPEKAETKRMSDAPEPSAKRMKK